jgi:predicted transcriptional regulator
MDKTTLYLTPELARALKEVARRQSRPQAEVIREALTQYLGNQEAPRLESIGIGEYGKLSATDIDAWLEENWRPG